MKALVLKEKGKLVLSVERVPELLPGELLIRTKAATICTSDLNDIKYNHFGIKMPMVMGHEASGVVEKVGAGAEGFAIGDEVGTHPVMHCGECVSCRRGLYHLCDDMAHLGLNRSGAFAEFFAIRADRARLKPKNVSFPAASLAEPISVCIEAIERGNVKAGGNVLIIGDGPFGIICARLLKGYNPGRVIVSGHHPFRLNMSGALAVNQHETPDVTGKILELTEGEGIDTAILCVGNAAAVATAIETLRSRGTLSVFSAVNPSPAIDLFKVHVKELNICGSCNDDGELDKAVEFLQNQAADFEALVTHRLPFADWEKAFALAEHGKDEAVKISLLFD